MKKFYSVVPISDHGIRKQNVETTGWLRTEKTVLRFILFIFIFLQKTGAIFGQLFV